MWLCLLPIIKWHGKVWGFELLVSGNRVACCCTNFQQWSSICGTFKDSNMHVCHSCTCFCVRFITKELVVCSWIVKIMLVWCILRPACKFYIINHINKEVLDKLNQFMTNGTSNSVCFTEFRPPQFFRCSLQGKYFHCTTVLQDKVTWNGV